MKPFTFLVLVLCWAHGEASAFADTGNWDLGRSIFEHGQGRDGREIGGRIHGGLMLRGEAVACSSCHGQDARGGGEAFIRVPDIRWLTLSKPYSPRQAGQPRPPYTVQTFSRALHQGVASGNRDLDPGMPRFDLSQDETVALIEYLKTPQLFQQVTNSLDVVLSVMPQSPKNMMAQALTKNLLACSPKDKTSRFPPLEIIFYEHPSDATKKITTRLSKGGISVILSPYIVGWERHYLQAAQEWTNTTLLPLTPLDIPITSSFGFQFPGLKSQLEALMVKYAPYIKGRLIVMTGEESRLTRALVQFVLVEAKEQSFAVEVVSTKDRYFWSEGDGWLILASLKELAKWLGVQESEKLMTVLIPAMFFDPEIGKQLTRNFPAAHWMVGYPYNPVSLTGKWRSPYDAWSGAACSLLSALAEKPYEQWDKEEQSFTANDGFPVMNATSSADLKDQVVILEWDGSKQ